MEIVAINKNSIKFSLTREELSARGLSAETLDSSADGAKRLIWELMDRARAENGFECKDARLLVRIFPSKDGGCELFVTLHGMPEPQVASLRDTTKKCVCTAVMSAEDDALLALCKRMKADGFRGKSRLYVDENNRLILILDAARRLPSYIQNANRLSKFAYLNEYGKIWEVSETQKVYITEHAKLLCAKKAVEYLSDAAL